MLSIFTLADNLAYETPSFIFPYQGATLPVLFIVTTVYDTVTFEVIIVCLGSQ